MNHPRRVSIITPVYNGAQFFPDTIRSVLGQTFTDWEWLIVDDGSTDGSLEMAQELARREPRVRVYQHPGGVNRGQAASRNLAVAQARADLWAMVDADDVWVPEKLERDLATFARHPRAQLIYSRMLMWHRWPGHPAGARTDYGGHLGIATDQVFEPPELLRHFIRYLFTFECQYPAPSCVTVRRSAKPPDEPLFESTLGHYEDAAPICRVLLRHPAVVCDDIRTWHRRGGESFTSSVTEAEQCRNFSRIADWIEHYLKSSGLDAAQAALEELRQTRRKVRRTASLRRRRAALAAIMNVARVLLPDRWRDWLWHRLGHSLWYRGDGPVTKP